MAPGHIADLFTGGHQRKTILVITGDVFDVGNVSSLQKRWRESVATAVPTAAEHQSWSRRHKQMQNRKVYAIFAKFRSTFRVAWSSPVMFFTLATCHLFEKWWCESVATVVASCVEHKLPLSPFHNFQISTILLVHFAIYFTKQHFTFCIVPTPTTKWGSNEEAEVDTCNPSRKVIYMGPAGTCVARDVSVFCLCAILVCGIVYAVLFYLFFISIIFLITTTMDFFS